MLLGCIKAWTGSSLSSRWGLFHGLSYLFQQQNQTIFMNKAGRLLLFWRFVFIYTEFFLFLLHLNMKIFAAAWFPSHFCWYFRSRSRKNKFYALRWFKASIIHELLISQQTVISWKHEAGNNEAKTKFKKDFLYVWFFYWFFKRVWNI